MEVKVVSVFLLVLMSNSCWSASSSNPTNSSNTSLTTNTNNSSSHNKDEDPLGKVIQCFRADSLIQCFSERVTVLFKVWRESFLNNVRKNPDATTEISSRLEGVIQEIGSAVYDGFTTFFFGNQTIEEVNKESARNDLLSDETDLTDPEKGTERGHHKKKKVHKEIKKFVLKIILAIFLFKLKIRMFLHMIQTILLNKFIIVATLYVLTLTFKIWWEIKQHHKHQHHEKQVIYYDNVHHDHSYDVPEHYPETEEGHSNNGHGWNLWGRSYGPPTTVTPEVRPPSQMLMEGVNSPYRNSIPFPPNTRVKATEFEDEFS